MPSAPQALFSRSNILLILAILFLAANLRGPMTSIAPLFGFIQADFQLSDATVGLLTSLPLLVLAVLSSLCAPLARKFGLERMLFIAIFAITLGIFIRSSGSLAMLYLGTACIGVGIASGNVLLPALVKRDFPQHIAKLTSAYALTMGIAAALVSALMVPLSYYFSGSWLSALSFANVIALPALLLWVLQLKGKNKQTVNHESSRELRKPIWRYALSWQVAFFFACNSAAYYTLISWLPAILTSQDYSSSHAGHLHGLMQLASAGAGLLQVLLLHRLKDQRGIAFFTTTIATAAIVGLWLMPQWAIVWAPLYGFGNGATFILALAFFGLRTNNMTEAAALSGMAQSCAYLFAAFAPWLMGKLYSTALSWDSVLIALIFINSLIALFGLFAGRNIKIS